MTDSKHNPFENQLGANYNDDYLNWKNWDPSKFGSLDKAEEKYFLAELKRTRQTLTAESSVLEVGFGNGSFLKFAKNQRWRIYGIEVNPALVDTAQRQGFEASCADNLGSFPDKSFDLVAAFDVLEHIQQHKILGFLVEVRRVLKPNGIFIARFPNGDSPFGLANQNGDTTHITCIGSSKASYFASQLGVELVYLGGQAQPLFGGSVLHVVHRLFALPIKALINLWVNLIFFPRAHIAFCSSDLVMVFRAPKP
jgi:SAM-dependent methyltransferase